MKKAILLQFLLISLTIIKAQTTINSDIVSNTTWTKTNSPYLVQNKIVVIENVTLNIEPGVVVKINNISNLMDVYGTIIAEGSISEPIIFTYISDDAYGGDSNNDSTQTVPKAGDWGSIEVMDSSLSSSSFQNCLFRFGGRIHGTLFVNNSAPQVSDCQFQSCEYGLEIDGYVNPIIENNQFEGTTKFPIIITPGSKPVFSGNSFSNNKLTGLGLKRNSYSKAGNNDTLYKTNLGGINNIPYIITNKIAIAENTSLTINPGVVLKNYVIFDMFSVDGRLTALGTTNEPIVFTTITDDAYGGDSNNDADSSISEASDWGSIQVMDSSAATSSFQNCLFRFGGRIHGTLFANNSAPQVSDCQFQSCKYGLEIDGYVNPIVENNQFEDITLFPILITPGSKPVFSGNSFSNNKLTGLGLKKNSYTQAGASDTLKKIILAGIDNITYILDSKIVIPENTSLTIEPGLTLKNNDIFDMFSVDGRLSASGTTNEPIVFTTITDDAYGGDSNNDTDSSVPEASDWGSIQIMDSSAATSCFQNCLFRFGGRIHGTLFANNSAPQVSDCQFQSCEYGLEIDGYVSPVVENNQFEEITKFPIIITPGSKPVFSGNSFSNNILTGLGLKNNSFTEAGAIDTLKKINLAGIENITYIIENRIDIPVNTTLSIEPGVILKYNSFIDMIRVYGTLIAEGSMDEPIVFTYISDDAFGGDSNNDLELSKPEPGQWQSILMLDSISNTSSFKNCVFRYGGRLDGTLYVNNCSPLLEDSKFEYCKTGLKISNETGIALKNLEFSNSFTGLEIQMNTSIVQVDSSRFFQNTNAISIVSGDAIINNCEFDQNFDFDISNSTANDIDATHNWWGKETFLEMIVGANPKNMSKFSDNFDDNTLGIIDYSDFVIPDNQIIDISPNIGTQILDTVSVTMVANPVLLDSKLIFYNDSNGVWNPDSLKIIDSLHIKSYWSFSNIKKGKYDVILINGNDSILLKNGFSLVESETPFGQWVNFEENREQIFSSGILLPAASRIYCLLKKATHVNYSSTWRGGIKIFKDNEEIAGEVNSASDIEIMLENVDGGYYTFDILSNYPEFWNGSIKFCLDPDTIAMNEWEQGEVLRPYGSDWKVFELTGDYSEITIQTQGYGLWSNFHVYYEYIGNKSQHWFFNNSGKGYNISGTIQNPLQGKYYLKYVDSAVLYEGKSYSKDQTRGYMINVSTTGIQPEPQQEIEVIKISSYLFGQDYATLEITGKGLTDSTFVQLSNANDTIAPVQWTYNADNNSLYVDFDFSIVDTGQYYLNLRNDISNYVHNKAITVELDMWEPIGIQIIGNEKYRVGRHQSVIVKITNNSNSNIKNGYVVVEFTNDNILMNIEDSYYTPEYNDTINMVLEELGVKRQIYFYSNLPPKKDVYIHLKMYSKTLNAYPIGLDVTSGVIDDANYDTVFSVIANRFIEGYLSWPLPQNYKDTISNYPYNRLVEDLDLVTDLHGLNNFNYIEDYSGKNSAHISNKSQTLTGTTGRRFRRVVRTTDVGGSLFGTMLVFTAGGKWEVGGSLVSTGNSTLLPAGIGDAFGGPLGLARKLISIDLNIAGNILAALQGYTGGAKEEKKQSHELEWFVWVKSTTPEDKYGPIGASVALNDSLSNHFVDSTKVFDYRIDYWNKEDATAPAAIVYIRDTLDTDFDLSTFNFTEVGFLKWTAPLEGGQYFNVNIDTRPDMPYIVNIEGSVDPDTREAYWVHTTLDTATMELTDDPEGGYLPPIDTTGYQVGWVSYTIESFDSLPDGTNFTNQAFVNFDGVGKWGPAPKEGPFTNIFDFTSPISSVLDGTTQSFIDSALVTWSGTDVGSGINNFTIYVSDGDTYVPWLVETKDTAAWFHGELGKTYHFYSIATDLVGNIEQKSDEPEHNILFNLTNISDARSRNDMLNIYPNPTTGLVNIESNLPFYVSVYTLSGKNLVQKKSGVSKIILDLSYFESGMYFIKVEDITGNYFEKIIIY